MKEKLKFLKDWQKRIIAHGGKDGFYMDAPRHRNLRSAVENSLVEGIAQDLLESGGVPPADGSVTEKLLRLDLAILLVKEGQL
jgi:hypothetical protein